MPRPIPVYIVERPSFLGQVIVALVIAGLALALLKLAIIAALGLGASYLGLRVLIAAPRLFFSVAIWGVGLYFMSRSVPLMLGWTVVWFTIAALTITRGGKSVEANTVWKALPAPDA